MSFGTLPRSARAYILGVFGVALILVIIGAQVTGNLDSLGGNPAQAALDSNWWIFATLLVAASVAHIFPVSSYEHRQAYHVSLPFFGSAAILLPPLPLALLILVVHVAEWIRRPQRSWFAQAFNLAVYIVSAALAQAVYLSLWDGWDQQRVNLTAPLCLLAGAAAVVVFGVLNRALVSGVIWLGNGIPPSRQQMLFGLESLFTDACLLAMGVPLARLALDTPWALVLGAAPVLLIHRALDLPNIRAQARRDQLTQLATAAAFKDACTRELSRARHFGRPLALAILEIEQFEQIVASHGRQAADVLLRDAARLLEQAARAYDVPARLDRAQFGLLLPETDASFARAMVEHVRRTLTERGFDVASSIEQVRVTLRAGVAAVQSDAVTVEQLFETAYAALARGIDAEPVEATVPSAPSTNTLHAHAGPAQAGVVARTSAKSAGVAHAGAASADPNGRPADQAAASQSNLSRATRLALLAVSGLATAILIAALPSVSSLDPAPLAFLMLMVAVGEVLSLQLFDRSAFSISVAPCLAAGMLPGVPGIVVAAPISAIVRGVYRRTRWYKVLFNASTYILAGTAAGLIFQVFGPTLDAQNLPLLLLLAGLAGLAYYTVARYSLQWSWRSRVARACSTCGWSISAGCGRSTSC